MAAGEEEDIVIRDFQLGVQTAFQELFRDFYPALCYYGERLLQDRYAAEEIAQDSLLKLWERHAGFSDKNSIKAFLYITVRNACLKNIRSQQRYQGHIDALSLFNDEHQDPTEFELIRTDVYHSIYQALSRLPPQCAKIIHMSYLDGMKNHEIAEKLNISEQTVKNQKVKALKLLKGFVAKDIYLITILPLWLSSI